MLHEGKITSKLSLKALYNHKTLLVALKRSLAASTRREKIVVGTAGNANAPVALKVHLDVLDLDGSTLAVLSQAASETCDAVDELIGQEHHNTGGLIVQAVIAVDQLGELS